VISCEIIHHGLQNRIELLIAANAFITRTSYKRVKKELSCCRKTTGHNPHSTNAIIYKLAKIMYLCGVILEM